MKKLVALFAFTALLEASATTPTPQTQPTPAVNAVDIQLETATLDIGGTRQLIASVSVSNGASQAVNWSVNPAGAGVVTVSNTGLVTAIGPGQAIVTATSQTNAARTDSTTITVNAPAPTVTVTAVSLQANPTTVLPGQSSTLSATVTGTGAFDQGVTFSVVSGGGAITNTSADGRTAIYTAPAVTAPTTVTVRAAARGDASKTATATITVNPAPQVTGVNVTANPTAITVGNTSQVSANVTGTGGFTPGVTFSVVSGPGTLSSATGTTATLTGTVAGTVVVRATSVGVPTRAAEVSVTVAAPVSTQATLTGRVTAAAGAAIGGATVAVAGVGTATTASDGRYTLSLAPGSYSVTFSAPGFLASSPVAVVVSAGQTATLDSALSATPPVASVTGVSVSAIPPTVTPGGTAVLTAAVSGTGNYDQAVVWSIVSGTGALTATTGAAVTLIAPNQPGAVVVRATSVADPSRFGEATVTVVGITPDPAAVSVTASPSTINSGGSSILTVLVTGRPAGRVVFTVTGGGTIRPTSETTAEYVAPTLPAGGVPLTISVRAALESDLSLSGTTTITVLAPPAPPPVPITVTGITVTQGSDGEYNRIVITGTGLNQIYGVSFDGVCCTGINSQTSTELVVYAPPGGTGTVLVALHTSLGAPVDAGSFTYTPHGTLRITGDRGTFTLRYYGENYSVEQTITVPGVFSLPAGRYSLIPVDYDGACGPPNYGRYRKWTVTESSDVISPSAVTDVVATRNDPAVECRR